MGQCCLGRPQSKYQLETIKQDLPFEPESCCIDSFGHRLFFTDANTNIIKILYLSDGKMENIKSELFSKPKAIVFHSKTDTLYVADEETVLRISCQENKTSTSLLANGFKRLSAMTIDEEKEILYVIDEGHVIRSVNCRTAEVQVVEVENDQLLWEPDCLCFIPSKNSLLCFANNEIVQLSLEDATRQVISGVKFRKAPRDGDVKVAEFDKGHGIAYDPIDDVIFVTQLEQNNIRRIERGSVSTIPSGPSDSGIAFLHPTGICVSSDHTVFLCDTSNKAIRKLTFGKKRSSAT